VPVRRLAAVLAGTLSALARVIWAVSPAHAHATLTASSPADGASVEQSPTEALLTFNEAPDPVLSAVRVLGPSGRDVGAGRAEVVAGKPARCAWLWARSPRVPTPSRGA
jgi:copper transport protein